MPTTTRPTTELSARDRMIRQLTETKKSVGEERAALQAKLDEAQAAFDAWEAPKKNLERIGREMTELVAQFVSTEMSLRREIEAAIPAVLRKTIAETKAELGVRQGAKRENCEHAVRQLEQLVFSAGDLLPKIRQILTAMHDADLANL